MKGLALLVLGLAAMASARPDTVVDDKMLGKCSWIYASNFYALRKIFRFLSILNTLLRIIVFFITILSFVVDHHKLI